MKLQSNKTFTNEGETLPERKRKHKLVLTNKSELV